MKKDDLIAYLNAHDIPFEYVENGMSSDKLTFASLKHIIEEGIYYFEDARLVDSFEIKNSILVVKERVETKYNNDLLIVNNPQLVHYKLCSLATPKMERAIAKSAKISKDAVIGKNVYIGENCVINHCVIEDNVVIKHNVVIEDQVLVKDGSYIDSNSVIGAPGLAWIWDETGNRIMQPQLGGVIIGSNCHLATDVTVVKGSLSESTMIGDGTVIAHGTKIGHGAVIGKNVHMANNVSLAGNAFIGDNCFLGSACIVSSNITVSKHTIIGAGALVNKNFSEEYLTLAGVPAKILKRNNFKEKPKGAPKPFKN